MNAPRVRLSVTAAHSPEDFDAAIRIVGEAARVTGLIET